MADTSCSVSRHSCDSGGWHHVPCAMKQLYSIAQSSAVVHFFRDFIVILEHQIQ